MNILQNGLDWLSRQQNQFASSRVTYFRNEKELYVNAVLGRTSYEIVDENGFRIANHAIDFLIRSDELKLIPQIGDTILAENIIYEVIDLGDGCWRWSDPHSITRRIHTSIYKEK
ncbi:MAG: hypothetical protein LBB88_11015 [Planctomycetaceae bacterium]|jgi:hypothetical protein|nr:hypothetical protein [Planctomycetaceae bacterium]